jgi:hypothetical protein
MTGRQIMKNFIIISAAIISLVLSGCSYVTDMVEAGMTERASFSIDAEYSAGQVTITWDESASSSYFAGIEVYRTSEPDDEYSDYITVDDRFSDPGLANPVNTYTDTTPPAISGKTYFYRVAFIHWNEPEADRDAAHNYLEPWDGAGINIETNYTNHTTIDSISGYAKVVIP